MGWEVEEEVWQISALKPKVMLLTWQTSDRYITEASRAEAGLCETVYLKNEANQKFIVSDNNKYLALKRDFTLA